MARRTGMKKALVRFSWLGVASFGLLIVFFLVLDNPEAANFENFSIATVIFLILYSLGRGISTLTPSIVIPMIADTSDYEIYRTGRYVPGMMSALFSFVDKLVSSLSPTIVGFLVALIGYTDDFPQLGETLTMSLFLMTLFIAFGIPIIGWVISIIAMKFYKLDGEKMEEIQAAIAEMKKNKKHGDGFASRCHIN
ncbi:MFS transporter [Oceanobacillus salinisoli]|uniref:MFS transporter n=1 Tax=Oceanobacillus salinisoli TaxID=2678611 RepID=UPI001E3F119D|nr:MFS transporter [Oceanobacillus salinisoli]